MLREHDHVPANALPMVGIVVVNYFGGDMTMRCLESLELLTWPSDRLVVCLVDNGSDPGWPGLVRTRFPRLRLVEAWSNVGFGGACNLGFDALPDCEYLALLNNDAIPEPDWLEPLVAALEADPKLGAATPKVLLQQRWIQLRLTSTSTVPGAGDVRRLGVQLCGARTEADDLSSLIEIGKGFWGWEVDSVMVGGTFAWTDGCGRAVIPVEQASVRGLSVCLASGLGKRRVAIRVGVGTDSIEVTGEVTERARWIEVPGTVAAANAINNAGTKLLPDGSTADYGYLQPEDPAFAAPAEVFGWSGAAVLLSRVFLDDVGVFDPRFFLYYEDADLSWRGRLRGWSYQFVPTSVVRHLHSATVGSRSALAQHLTQRNRLLMLTKVAPGRLVAAAWWDAGRITARALWRDVAVRAAHFRRPQLGHAAGRLRILGGAIALAPAGLRERRRIGRRLSVSRKEWVLWLAFPRTVSGAGAIEGGEPTVA